MDDVVLLLANSAEVSPQGMVSGLGIGWSVTSSPTAPAALILMIKVPWDQTNVKHAALLRLVDADGHDVRLGESEPIHIKLDSRLDGRQALLMEHRSTWRKRSTFVRFRFSQVTMGGCWRLTVS